MDPTMMSQPPKIWLVTGASQGLGREIVHVVLARNDKVIATARDVTKVQDLEETYNVDGSDVVRALQLDVTVSEEQLRQKAAEAVGIWGRVDVLVNNAAMGMTSISEEMGFDGYMKQFMTNFFGPINVTHTFLPYMRQRRQGTIVFIGSRSSWRARLPMFGPYASSKAALMAAAESLKAELAPFNIRVLPVLPGGIRTANWLNMVVMPPASAAASLELSSPNTEDAQLFALKESARDGGVHNDAAVTGLSSAVVTEPGRIPDYARLRGSTLDWMYSQNGIQQGDPLRTAIAIVDVVRGEGLAAPNQISPSVHANRNDKKADLEAGQPWPEILVLGKDAEQNIRERCQNVLQWLDEWKDVTGSIAIED